MISSILVQTSYQVNFSAVHCTRGGIRKGDILVADIEELERMDATEIHATGLDAKEVLTPMKMKYLCSHLQLELSKP